jgi:protein-L-isoaspartate(D-aspartate) O-methyltransferase
LQPGGKVLDVGSGTGLLCAAFYEMVKLPLVQKTCVVGIEHIQALAELSFQNLSKSYSE